jgi:hypothetical protein
MILPLYRDGVRLFSRKYSGLTDPDIASLASLEALTESLNERFGYEMLVLAYESFNTSDDPLLESSEEQVSAHWEIFAPVSEDMAEHVSSILAESAVDYLDVYHFPTVNKKGDAVISSRYCLNEPIDRELEDEGVCVNYWDTVALFALRADFPYRQESDPALDQSRISVRQVNEPVEHKFTQQEKIDLSLKNIELEQQKFQLEFKLKSVVKQIQSEIQQNEGARAKVRESFMRGSEMRNVDVLRLDNWNTFTVRFLHPLTKEQLWERDMTDEERYNKTFTF